MHLRLSLLFLSISLAACTQSGFNVGNGSSDNGSLVSPDNGGAGAVQLQFNSPTADLIAIQNFKAGLTADPIASLKELRLFINGTETFKFRQMPFELEIDPSKYTGCLLTLKAQALDQNNLLSFRTLNIKKTPDCVVTEPNPAPAPLPTDPSSSKNAGTFDTHCLTNNTFDACLFWKNPVAQRGSAYATPLHFGQDLAEQSFGVKLTGLLNRDKLENNSISVWSANAPAAIPQGGNWRYPYKSDADNHFVAQVMAYFWLTYQEKQMATRTGKFFASGKSISVNAYNPGVQNNAFWDGRQIVMGVATDNGNLSHEMALSAEVYLHEMGHANLQFAMAQPLQDTNNAANQAGNKCRTQDGCLGAINEGQADFHFIMLFSENTVLGETFVNSMGGMSANGISRDVRKLTAMKLAEFFSRSGGEIHGMGSFYSSVLWEIYNDPKMLKPDFEKMFTSHLQKLTASTRFQETRDILLADDLAFFGGKYKTVIQSSFESKGVP